MYLIGRAVTVIFGKLTSKFSKSSNLKSRVLLLKSYSNNAWYFEELSFLYDPKERVIKSYFNDGTEQTFNQSVGGKHSWSYYIPKDGLEKIDVFENDRLLYSETNKNVFANMYLKW